MNLFDNHVSAGNICTISHFDSAIKSGFNLFSSCIINCDKILHCDLLLYYCNGSLDFDIDKIQECTVVFKQKSEVNLQIKK